MPRILVADDNSNIQKMVALAFEEQGIDVIAVGNGEAAVRRLPDVLPDIILADVFMPVRNGYEVCEYVKKDKRFAHTPVILLVGAFDPLDEVEMRRVGADGVLKKPFVPPDPLVSMVMGIIAKLPKPEPKVEAAPAIVEPVKQVVPAVTAKAAPETSAQDEEYAFGTGRRSLDDDGPAELSSTKNSQPTAHASVITAVELPSASAPEDDTSFIGTHAEWRRSEEVDSASVPDFSAELVAEPPPAVVEAPPEPAPIPEREIEHVEFLDATETAHAFGELEPQPEPESHSVAVEYYEPPPDAPPLSPSTAEHRAVPVPPSDLFVVEPEERTVVARNAVSSPEAAAESRVESKPERVIDNEPDLDAYAKIERKITAKVERSFEVTPERDYAAKAQHSVETTSPPFAEPSVETPTASRGVATASENSSEPMNLVAPALAQPSEWSTSSESASTSVTEVPEATAEVARAESGLLEPPASDSPVTSDSADFATADAAFASSALTDVESANSASATFETSQPAAENSAAPTSVDEPAHHAVQDDPAIRAAEAEGVAHWEAASHVAVQPAVESVVEHTDAASVPQEITAESQMVSESATTHAESASEQSAPLSVSDAANIAANAVLASLGASGTPSSDHAALVASSTGTAKPDAPTAAQINQSNVDEVVAKVIERLGPQLQEILANGLVRPLVEALLQKPPDKKE